MDLLLVLLIVGSVCVWLAVSVVRIFQRAGDSTKNKPGGCSSGCPGCRNTYKVVLLGVCYAGIAAFLSPFAVWAGPPLVSDDPGTVGSRSLEIIVATAGMGQSEANTHSGPILDLTYGLTDRFDLGLIFEAVHLQQENYSIFEAAPVSAGCKWQFVSTRSFASSVAPEVAFDVKYSNDATLTVPFQLQYSSGAWHIGSDLRFSIARKVANAWQVGLYAGRAVWDKVSIMADLWGASLDKLSLMQSGWSLGVDATLNENLHLLVGGGTGIHADQGDRLEWRSFFGLLWIP